ncbi:MAG TPA: ATP-binding protein [Pilimelia sp.]|nr:ATP-binding protein [Pilimelia sp.]
MAQRRHLAVDTAVAPVEVFADPMRLRQMINNLMSNAIKYTPPGGHVTVTGGRSGHRVAVSVADTGIGIAAEDLPRLFQRFQQIGDPSHHQAGTGLGLALTQELAHAHGGEVTVESTRGDGSTFTLTLPAGTPVGGTRTRPDDVRRGPRAG